MFRSDTTHRHPALAGRTGKENHPERSYAGAFALPRRDAGWFLGRARAVLSGRLPAAPAGPDRPSASESLAPLNAYSASPGAREPDGEMPSSRCP